MRRTGLYIGIALGLAAGLLLGPLPARSQDAAEGGLKEQFFEPLAWLVAQIQEHTAEPLETPAEREEFIQRLLVGAYHGILSECDRYSVYWPPEMLEEFKDDLAGQFGGLGISIRFDNVLKVVVVEQPIPGEPAQKAGIDEGDMIVKVLEVETGVVTETAEFRTVHDAVRVLRGEPGTEVVITVVPAGGGPNREVTIKRGIIQIPGVRAVEMIDPDRKIGYVIVPYFSQPMVKDLRSAIDHLMEEGAEGLILDVRHNPGGLLTAAKHCADLFLRGKPIVRVKSRTDRARLHRASRRAPYGDVPLVLLINRQSASGSEILAAALRDNGRALLVGESTYGKASVQQLFDNPHGEGGAIKLTVARYYTPDDELIEGKGVVPDVEVELSDEDNRRLALHLSVRAAYPPRPLEEEDEAEEGDADEEEEEEFVDVQLARAIDAMIDLLDARAAQVAGPADEVLVPAPGG